MSGIKSTVAMLYEPRSSKLGMIEIEVLGWTYEPIGGRYITRVADYVILTQEEVDSHGVLPKQMIAQKEVSYSKDEIDTLFSTLGNSIDTTESFSAEMDRLISQALLLVTQQEPVYWKVEDGVAVISTPEEWIIKSE